MPFDRLSYIFAKFVLSVTPTAPVGSVLFNICNSCKVHASVKDFAKCELQRGGANALFDDTENPSKSKT